jgi:hypothetical protein
MTTATDTPTPGLTACVEIAERLTTELANSLRWLATHSGSGATLVIEGFVRDGELVLVADIPGEPGFDPENGSERLEPARKESSSQRPAFSTSVHRGLLSFALPLTPDARKSPLSVGAHAAALPSIAS